LYPKKLLEREESINHTVSQSKNLNGNAWQTTLDGCRTHHHFRQLMAPHLSKLENIQAKCCYINRPEALKSWEYLMLRSLTHDEIIVEAKRRLGR